MSTTRAAIWIVGLAVPAILWGCMTAAKNDLLVTTRFIVRHIRRIEADVRPNDAESERQQAKGQSRFRRRYSFPRQCCVASFPWLTTIDRVSGT